MVVVPVAEMQIWNFAVDDTGVVGLRGKTPLHQSRWLSHAVGITMVKWLRCGLDRSVTLGSILSKFQELPGPLFAFSRAHLQMCQPEYVFAFLLWVFIGCCDPYSFLLNLLSHIFPTHHNDIKISLRSLSQTHAFALCVLQSKTDATKVCGIPDLRCCTYFTLQNNVNLGLVLSMLPARQSLGEWTNKKCSNATREVREARAHTLGHARICPGMLLLTRKRDDRRLTRRSIAGHPASYNS